VVARSKAWAVATRDRLLTLMRSIERSIAAALDRWRRP
jgi:hypothetical protein